MKNALTALALLLALFGISLYNAYYIENTLSEMIVLLEESGKYAGLGDWDKAGELADEAKELWEKSGTHFGIVLRHSETDDIYFEFESLPLLVEEKDESEYKAGSALLIARMKHVFRMEKLSLENIF